MCQSRLEFWELCESGDLIMCFVVVVVVAAAAAVTGLNLVGG
jgi:hypothetical protein